MPHPSRAPLALVAFLPLLVLVSVVEVVLVWIAITTQSTVTAAILKYAVLFPLGAVIWSVYQSLKKVTPAHLSGLEISPDEAPDLWDVVAGLAMDLGFPPPSRIVVTPDPGSAARWVGAQVDIAIGLPLLATLTVPELRACVAQELGHLARPDRWPTRVVAALDWLHAIRETSTGGLAWFLGWYIPVYGLLAEKSLVAVEHAADELAVEVAGREATLSALRRLPDVGGAWAFVGDNFLPLFDGAGRRAPLVEALARVLEAFDDLDDPDEQADEALPEQPRSAAEIHQRDRIATIEKSHPTPGPEPDRTPASDLIRGGVIGLDSIESELLVRDWPVGAWDEVVADAGSQAVHVAGHQLGTFLQRRGIADTSLGGVVRLLEDSENPDNPPLSALLAVNDEMAAELLVPVITAALIDAGAVRFVPDWPDTMKLVDADGNDTDLQEIADRACERPGGGAYLREWLVARSVNLDAAVGRQDPERPDWIAALSHVTGPWQGRYDVHIWSTGLLALPIPEDEVVRDKATAFNAAQRDRMRRAAALGVQAGRALPGALWIDRADVVGGWSGRRRLLFGVGVKVATGQQSDVSATLDTEFIDSDEEVESAVGYLLSIPIDD